MTEKTKVSYKDTLNLPQTGFPMKASLSQREPDTIKKWQTTELYQKIVENNKGREKFVFEDGPPYANGHIHIGHALNKTLKDMVVKSKVLSGFDSVFIPGWDCHGLPIELNVEKKWGKPGRKISEAEFRDKCREYARSFIDIQRSEFERLGIIGDWQNPYLTMDAKYEANIVRSLGKIIENGHVTKGYKPVHWCLDCSSALAEAEVEYKDKTSPSIDVRFAVVDEQKFFASFHDLEEGKGAVSVPIWTTTPWTLPANQAVALNALLQYVLVEVNEKERLLIAEDLLTSVLDRIGIEHHRILGKVAGEKLEGLQLQHPFYERKVPIVLGDHVTVEAGTGAVHTAPAHGQEDFVVAQQYNLPVDNPVGDDGVYIKSTELFAGTHVSKANEEVIDVLKKNDVLLSLNKLTHSYPHCWRHKTGLIFRSTPQWFISMDENGLRDMAMQSIEKISWIPNWGKARIISMIEGRPDWCISRQRTWGTPITLFLHKETGEMHPDTVNLIEAIAKQMDEKGIEAWHECKVEDFLGDDAKDYRKCNDVLDVWFDSGVSHECVLKHRHELNFPADLVLEGSDQHRGWFQSALLTSLAINGSEPYKAALTHGFTVDANGHKMSKSLGNVIAPDSIIKTLGADILRLWAASVDYRGEITTTQDIFKRTSEMYRRMRNTARFFLANLNGFNPESDLLPADEMLALDRWAVDKARRIQEEILKAYETYQFHLVVQKVHHFCVTDMGGFYLDIIKDRQYTMAAESRGRRSAQSALYHIVQAFSRWMAPILSFTSEEIWKFIPEQNVESVFLTEWYQDLSALDTNDLMNEEYWDTVRQVRDAVNKEIEELRNQDKVGSALEAEVTLYCGSKIRHVLDALESELRFVLITSSATVLPDSNAPLDATVTDVPGLSLKIVATTNAKCDRCWHRVADVDANQQYPGLCGRCVENIAGSGEKREYA